MTTLYVNSDAAIGDDTVSVANNTELTPFRTLIRAREETLAAEDTLNVTGFQRDTIYLVDGVSYNLHGAILACSRNYTQGEGYSLPLIASPTSQKGGRSFFQDWTLDVPNGWTSLGTPLIQDTVDFYLGDRSLRINSTAQGLQQQMLIPFSGSANLTVGYKNDSLAHQGRLQIRALGPSVYWNGVSWQAGVTYVNLPSSTDWTEYSINNLDMSGLSGVTKLLITVNVVGGSDTLNVQTIIVDLIPKWSVYSGDTYQLEVGSSTGAEFIFKCSTDAWDANGVYALQPSFKGLVDRDNLGAGEWIYTSPYIYYRLAASEVDITKIHLEGIYQRCIHSTSNNDFTIYGGDLIGGIQGVRIDTASTGIVLHGTNCHKNQSVGFYTLAGGEARWYGGSVYDCLNNVTPKGEGMQNVGGTMYAEGVHVYNVFDNCGQPNGGLTEFLSCLMHSAEGSGDPIEIAVDGTAIVRKCTLINDSVGAFAFVDGSTVNADVTLEDTIIVQNSTNAAMSIANLPTTGSKTVNRNMYHGAGAASGNINGAGASAYTSGCANTDTLVDEKTGELPSNSPALRLGINEANAVGANGEPIANVGGADLGCCPSAHGPYHPLKVRANQ